MKQFGSPDGSSDDLHNELKSKQKEGALPPGGDLTALRSTISKKTYLLSPCQYDIPKVEQCVKDKLSKAEFDKMKDKPSDCEAYMKKAENVIEDCKKANKGCTYSR